MANDTSKAPLEMGAAMDYSEHDKTYSMFLGMVKYGTLACSALMIAMAFGFFAGGGFIFSTLLFAAICVVGGFVL